MSPTLRGTGGSGLLHGVGMEEIQYLSESSYFAGLRIEKDIVNAFHLTHPISAKPTHQS